MRFRKLAGACEAHGGMLFFLFGFLLYAFCAAPSVSLFGDSAELASAARVGGVAHAPGYAILSLVGYSLSFLPAARFDGGLHLTSSLFHAATVGVMFHVLRRVTRHSGASCFGAGLLLFSGAFFSAALYFEAFPLLHLSLAVVMFLSLRVRQDSKRNDLSFLAASLGFAGAHHQMAILVVPLVGVICGKELLSALRAPGRFRIILFGLVPFLSGVLLLVLLAARKTAYNLGAIEDLQSLWRHLSRQEYGGLLSSSKQAREWMPLARQLVLTDVLVRSLGPAACLLGAWGAVQSFTARSRIGAAMCLCFLVQGPLFFAINHVRLDEEQNLAWVERFAVGAHLPFVVLAALGFKSFASLGAKISRPLAFAFLSAVALVPPGLGVGARCLREDTTGPAFAQDLVEATPQNAILILSGDTMTSSALHHCLSQPCGERILIAPGGTDYAALRLRHTSLPDIGDLKSTSGAGLLSILRASIKDRPIYITPQLLTKTPTLRSEFQIIPSLLLLRVAEKTAPTAALVGEEILGTSAQCKYCDAFERLQDSGEIARPTMHAQTLGFYQAELDNFKTIGKAVGLNHDVITRLMVRRQKVTLRPWSSPIH